MPRGSDQETLLNISQQFSTYVDPRKNARDRWKLNKKTDMIAVRSIATEVEYTCEYANSNFINRDITKSEVTHFVNFEGVRTYPSLKSRHWADALVLSCFQNGCTKLSYMFFL